MGLGSACRICLSNKTTKNLMKLGSDINFNEDDGSYVDIIVFCLGIQISDDSRLSTKLCSKCYKNIIHFHKFKSLALKTDAFLKSQMTDELVQKKNEVYVGIDNIENNSEDLQDICNEVYTLDNHVHIDDNSKDEIFFKLQDIKKEDINLNIVELDNVHDRSDDIAFGSHVNCDVKQECEELNISSDEEFLSVLKSVKYSLVSNGDLSGSLKSKGIYKKNRKAEYTRQIDKCSQICEECGKSVKNLKTHLLLHQSNRKRYKCKFCDKTFLSPHSKYKHVRFTHKGQKNKCSICDKVVIALRSHILTMHNREQMPFACAVCSRRFLSKSALEIHVTAHTKARPFECDLCNNKYRSRLALLQHKRSIHHKERPHVCHICSKSFFKKYHLQVHLRTHTRERPYKCEQCDKMFSSTSALRSHKILHGNQKNHECTLCNMTFAKKGYLTAHMISHTKEKKHACKYCGLKYGRSDHRKRHEFTAHEKHLASKN